MKEIKINVKKPVAHVVTEDNIDAVWVPEPLDMVREREFTRRVSRAVKAVLPKLIQKKIDELQPNLQNEKKAEYERGFQDGESAGRMSEQEKLRELKDHLSVVIGEITLFRKKILKEAESTIVTMAFRFAKTIIGEEVAHNPDIVRNQVKKALDYVIDKGKMIIHINPDDTALFDNKEEFIPAEYLDSVEILPDGSVSKGGCIIETNAGTVDVTMEAQMAELEKSLANGRESSIESDS